MKPIEFEGHNVVFGKDQPEYLPLPALRTDDGTVITCWELTDDEIYEIVTKKKLWLQQLTFNKSLQPLLPSAYPLIENKTTEDNATT